MAAAFSIVLTTAPSEAAAQAIADRLLADGLAACVQSLPIRSAYRWKGSVARDDEILLLVKGKSADWPAIEAAIKSIHEYEVPEIVRVDMADASRAYLDWIEASTR
jgi:periplasmic divalent cation tolerance protein